VPRARPNFLEIIHMADSVAAAQNAADGAFGAKKLPDDRNQERLIESSFSFRVEKVFISAEGEWIASGWHGHGHIQRGAVGQTEDGAEMVFGKIRSIGHNQGREKLEFFIDGTPKKSHLMKEGVTIHGIYTLILPPFDAESFNKPSLSARRTHGQRPIWKGRPAPDTGEKVAQREDVAVWRFR